MRRNFVLAGLWVALVAPSAWAQDWARELFATTSHDFGSVARGAKTEFSFVITNNLVGDLHIAGVRASCGCTTPTIEKALLKTYERGAILAHLNSDRYLGQRSATLTVTIDQPAFAEVQLQIKGNVHDDLLMEPSSVELGTVAQGTPVEGHVRIYRATMPDWRILGVRTDEKLMSGQVVETARDGNAAWYDLTVRLAKTAPAGYVKEYVMLRTNDPLAPEIPVLVEGQIQPEVVVSPASLFLGVVRPGEKVTKQLVVRSDKPFRVTGVHGDPASLTFSAVSGEAKTLHLIPVTFLAGSEWGKVVKAIHIDTDLQKAPVEAASYAVVAPQQP